MIVRQAAALREGGADFIMFETQPTRRAVERCAAAMRQLPDGVTIVCIMWSEGGV